MNNQQTNQRESPEGIVTLLEAEEWYQSLVEECKAIVVETEFCSRLEIIKGKWLLGEAILQANESFERKKIYGSEIVSRVAESLGISRREIWRCIQFAKKYPKLVREENELSLDPFLEGKNISWRKIASKYLPEPASEEKEKCSHSEVEEISFLKCKNCKENLEGHSRILIKENIAKTLQDWARTNNFPKYNLSEEGSAPFTLSGEKEWEGYLKNQFRTIPELWKAWKRIEGKFIQRLQRSDPKLWE